MFKGRGTKEKKSLCEKSVISEVAIVITENREN